VHVITGHHRDVPLPVDGEFEYRVRLQMNVPPGAYHIRPFIWDSLKKQEVNSGPYLQVEVLDRLPFYGAVQMNSEWHVTKGAAGSVTNSSARQSA
jgi:hypothetical protein